MGDIKEEDVTDQNGKCSPAEDEKAKIGAKIHQFENGEREKVRRFFFRQLHYNYFYTIRNWFLN